MSTTIFAGSAPGIVYEGGVYDGSQFNTPNFFGGEYIQQAVGTNAKLRVNFTGTDCDLYVYCDGGTWGWTIDGGSLQTASPSGGNMQWLNVATGLSDTTHTLVLINLRFFVGWDKILRVTGAAPALSAPSGYTNPQFGFPSSGVTRDGSQYFTTGVEGYVGLTNNASCRFKATTSSIKIWNRYDVNSPIGLVIDDDITTLVRQNPSYGWGWTEFSGLDGSAEHSYRFIIPYGVYFYNFMAAGLNTTALTPYPVDYWQGDSITASTNISNGMAAPNYYVQYAIKAHRGWQVEAQAGATAATQGVAWKTHPGTASPTPDRVIIAFGTNDLGNAESSATWTSAISSIITQIHSDLPTKKIVWLGLFDTSFNHANRGTYNTDLSNTITAFGNSLVTYFSTDGTGTISTSDSVHPDATGSAALGNYLFNNLDGVPAITADSSTTTSTQTTSATAQAIITANASVTTSSQTLSATATVKITANSATTFAAQTTSATATVKVTANASNTVTQAGAATAQTIITANASNTVTQTLSATATTGSTINANSSTITSTQSLSATAQTIVTGNAAGTFSQAGAATATTKITANAAVTTSTQVTSATAQAIITANGSGTTSFVPTAPTGTNDIYMFFILGG